MLLRIGEPQIGGTGRAESRRGELRDLSAVVLLAGSVRASHLRRAAERSLLDLPVTPTRSVLGGWVDQLDEVARVFGGEHLPVRVVLDRGAPLPHVPETNSGVEMRVEQDPSDFRGTGGLISDLAREYDEHDYILVANAAQVLLEPLTLVIDALASVDADVTIACLPDGTPSDFMLLRCGALRCVKSVGFVDLKEQALPQIARDHVVRIVRRNGHAGLPVRTLDGYVEALRAFYRRGKGTNPEGGEPAEDWRVTFGLVESGARVADDAIIHDSVVLAGSVVDDGAVVVRSVVCAGGVVGRGASVVDRIVTSAANSNGKGPLW